MIRYGIYGSETFRYNPSESDSLNIMDNLDLFLNKIKAYKDIEVAALTYMGWGATPFSGNNNQSDIINVNDSTKITNAQVKNVFSGDYFRIFRYTPYKDKAWERVANIDLRKNNTVFITRQVEQAIFGNQSAIGKRIYADIGYGKQEYVVGEVLSDQKRFDYTLPYGAIFGAAPMPKPNNLDYFGVCTRTKSGISERQFISDFKKEMAKQLQIGNFYLKDIQSFSSIKSETEYMFGVTNEIRVRMALMLFCLLNIALGIIGTFWFRNQIRRGEIGLRMAMGSTRATLQRQFIVEALLLLTLAVIPAILINFFIARIGGIDLNMDIMMEYKTIIGSPYLTQNAPLRFLITNLITYFSLAAIVVLSAWIPARRASKMHLVEALRDE